MINTNCLVIYPKGCLSKRILILLSACILCNHLDINLKMIWDHRVPYNYLFLNNIELIEIKDLFQKNYIYNPNIDQSVMFNKLKKSISSDLYVIIETSEEFNHADMPMYECIRQKHLIFQEQFRKHISVEFVVRFSFLWSKNPLKKL